MKCEIVAQLFEKFQFRRKVGKSAVFPRTKVREKEKRNRERERGIAYIEFFNDLEKKLYPWITLLYYNRKVASKGLFLTQNLYNTRVFLIQKKKKYIDLQLFQFLNLLFPFFVNFYILFTFRDKNIFIYIIFN